MRTPASIRVPAETAKITTPPIETKIRTDSNPNGKTVTQIRSASSPEVAAEVAVALLTGGSDKHYVFGLTTALISSGAVLDVLGSDELDCPEIRNQPRVKFFNLRRDPPPDARFLRKALRVAMHYVRLIRYAATAKPKLFHILWNTKFELFDRTVLMLYYRLLGKTIVFTAHNVNAGRRDGNDTLLNRLTLRMQYRLSHHIFVHTEKMKVELIEEFGVSGARVTVIPFGINNAVPNTSLTPAEAKQRLGIVEDEKTLLSFGRITPYKGFEYLIAAFRQLLARGQNYRLIIAGRVDRCEKYWAAIWENLREEVRKGQILLKDEFISDDETEVYFKAADALVLAYTHIYQSGILFLGHSFGLPVLAADVGSFKDEIVEGKTGFVFRPKDPVDLARVIERYFASDLYAELNSRRREIRDYATQQHSWDVVGQITMNVYANLLRIPSAGKAVERDATSASVKVKAMQEEASANSGRAF
jgi:glycosyltransferase involved in cell wall biosynthesis